MSRAETERLIREWLPLARSLARHYHRWFTRYEGPEDTYARTLTAVWQAAKKYDPHHESGASFQTFLRRHIWSEHTAYLDSLSYSNRKIFRHSMSLFEEDGFGKVPEYRSPDPSAADHLQEKQEHQTLYRSIDKLAPQELALVELRLQGQTLAEIAALWGISRQRAQQIELEAIRHLRQDLRWKLRDRALGKRPISLFEAALPKGHFRREKLQGSSPRA